MADTSELGLIITAKDGATGVLGRVSGALESFGSAATKAGMDLLPLSVAAGAVAGSALKMAADYEQGMNVLQATSGATTGEMAALDNMAIQLGADITLPGTSAKDAAEAMLELSKAGLSVNDILAASKGVLQMSAAGQLSNARAAEITANALNTFGLEGEYATAVADMLAAAANASSTDVLGMADAIAMSGAVAAQAGLPMEYLTTAIAMMANAGIKGSDAGTSIKQMLLSLMAPTKESAELMSDMGISLYDAAGQFRPLDEIIQQFSGKLGPLTEQQRNAALATIFGSDAVRAANIVLMGGVDAFNKMEMAVTRSGAAADLASAQNTGLSGALDGLKSTMDTVLQAGARPLLETLTGFVTNISEMVGAFAAANPQLVTAGLAFAGVVAAAAPLALGIGMVTTALGALAGPIGIVILAVGALAAAFATDFMGIRTTVTQLVASWTPAWEAIRTTVETVLQAVWAVVQSVLGVVMTFVQNHGEQIRGFIQTAWTQIQGIIQTTLELINATIVPALQVIAGLISAHGAEIQAVLQGAWNVIQAVITTVLGVIQGVLSTVLAVIRGDWSGAWEAIKGITETVWEGIQTLISAALELIKGVINIVLLAIGVDFQKSWTEIQTFLTNTWNSISGTATTVWNSMKSAFSTPILAVENMLKNTWTRIKNFAVDTWNDIKAKLTGIVQSLIDWIRGAFAGFQIHIPMPHFEVHWEDIGFGVKLPKVDVHWYAKGGDFWANGPMLIGVGENGPEHVQITPAGKKQPGGGDDQIVININNPVVREELDIRRIAEAVSEVLGGEANTLGRMRYQWAS